MPLTITYLIKPLLLTLIMLTLALTATFTPAFDHSDADTIFPVNY